MTATKTPAKPRRARRAEGSSGRSLAGAGKKKMVPMHEALSGHALVPRVRDPSPSLTSKQQRFLQVLARHLARDDPWIGNLIRIYTETRVGVGPKVKSRFPELDALWEVSKEQFDNRGDYCFGDWLREIAWEKIVTGDLFIRRRDRTVRTYGRNDLFVPVQFQALQSEYVPFDFNQTVITKLGPVKFVCGIGRILDRVVYYAVYTEHPGESATALRPVLLPADEIYHVCQRRLGCPRGEVPLASALMRAIKAATLEDTELRRKMVASLMSIFVTRPVDAGDDFELPSEGEVSDMIDAIQLSPGGIFELPYGYKIDTFDPKDEPANFDRSLRWQLMAVCASIGMPPHEVLGDWNALPERMARYVGQTMERGATIDQRTYEHQLLKPMRADWIDVIIGEGQWTPPEDLQPWELYACEFEWPLLPMASFKQELNALVSAMDKGIISRGYIQKTMFGQEPAHVAREIAKEAAHADVLGLIWPKEVWENDTVLAARFSDGALEAETEEMDLVDASAMEDSILD